MGQYKLWIKTMRQYYGSKPWANINYGSTNTTGGLQSICAQQYKTQTMDQQLLWDDLQSICVQRQYTNTVKRRIDMGS